MPMSKIRPNTLHEMTGVELVEYGKELLDEFVKIHNAAADRNIRIEFELTQIAWESIGRRRDSHLSLSRYEGRVKVEVK